MDQQELIGSLQSDISKLIATVNEFREELKTQKAKVAILEAQQGVKHLMGKRVLTPVELHDCAECAEVPSGSIMVDDEWEAFTVKGIDTLDTFSFKIARFPQFRCKTTETPKGYPLQPKSISDLQEMGWRESWRLVIFKPFGAGDRVMFRVPSENTEVVFNSHLNRYELISF